MQGSALLRRGFLRHKCSQRALFSSSVDSLVDLRSRWVANLRDSSRAHNVFIVDRAHKFDRWAQRHLFGIIGNDKHSSDYNGKPHIAVGTDLEWRPGKSNAPGAVLQLSTPTSCCLVQLLYLDKMPAALKDLLMDPRILKVGVQVKQDLVKLLDDYDLPFVGHVDIGLAVPRLQVIDADTTQGEAPKMNGRTGLANLCIQMLKVEMGKSRRVQNSLWDSRQLSAAQIKYAAQDAILSREVFASAVAAGAFTERYFRETEIRALEEMAVGQQRNFRRLLNLFVEESAEVENIVYDLIKSEDERLMLVHHELYTGAAQAYSSRLHSNLLFLRQLGRPQDDIRVRALLQTQNLRCGEGVGRTRSEAVQDAARRALLEFLEVQRACDPSEFLDYVVKSTSAPQPFVDYFNSAFDNAPTSTEQFELLDENEVSQNGDAANESLDMPSLEERSETAAAAASR